MAVIGTASSVPSASTVRTDPQAVRIPTASESPAPASTASPPSAAPSAGATKLQPTPSDSSVFRLSVHYDASAHRIILEARDPVSGVVVYQQPPQSAFKQLLASVSPLALSPRGGTVDAAV
jgi:hypothetical protein